MIPPSRKGRAMRLAILCSLLLFPLYISAEDWAVTVEGYHDMALMGVHAQQKTEIKARLHTPSSVRLQKKGAPASVLYRYEEDGLVRYEINHDIRTYRRMTLDEAIRKVAETQAAFGLPAETEPPTLSLSGSLENGWREVHRSGSKVYLQYWNAGELVAAAAVEQDVPCPPPELFFALLCEIPVIYRYWVRKALSEVLRKGRLFHFEYLPRGPQYYCLWVTEYRKEATCLPDDAFRVPEGYSEEGAKGSAFRGDTEKSSAESIESNTAWEAKTGSGASAGGKNPASSASEPGRGSPSTDISSPRTITVP